MSRNIGIKSFASYIPPYFIDATRVIKNKGGSESDINKAHAQGIGIIALPGPGEDSTTGISDVTRLVLDRLPAQTISKINNGKNAFYAGTEIPPYREGPTIPGIVGDFLNLPIHMEGNIHGSCAGALSSLVIAQSLVESLFDFGFVGGSDFSIYREDEYSNRISYASLTAGAGNAGYCLGSDNPIAVLKEVAGFSSYTADWLIPQEQKYPDFSARTTIEAYKRHLQETVRQLNTSLHDVDIIVFHVPVEFLPFEAAVDIGLSQEEIEKKIRPYMLGRKFGNAYNATSLIHFNYAMEQLNKGLIAVLGYGSGARGLATIWEKNGSLDDAHTTPTVEELLSLENRMEVGIDYYYKWRSDYDKTGYLRSYGMEIKDSLVVLDDRKIVGSIEPLGNEMSLYFVCENEKCGAVYSPRSNPVYMERCVDDYCRSKLSKLEVPRYGKIKTLRELPEDFSITKAMLDGEYLIIWPRNQLVAGTIVEQKLRILGQSSIGRDGNHSIRVYGPAFELAKVSNYA